MKRKPWQRRTCRWAGRRERVHVSGEVEGLEEEEEEEGFYLQLETRERVQTNEAKSKCRRVTDLNHKSTGQHPGLPMEGGWVPAPSFGDTMDTPSRVTRRGKRLAWVHVAGVIRMSWAAYYDIANSYRSQGCTTSVTNRCAAPASRLLFVPIRQGEGGATSLHA